MFPTVIAMQNIIFKKILTIKIKYFCFADWPTLFCFAALPLDQIINLVLPYFQLFILLFYNPIVLSYIFLIALSDLFCVAI